ncbi:MAG: hypothetical protein M0R80_04035 [Proteobacteria bacterium]|jgi:hypothetical protein|nr:hypothetical protein [Pseudomonadota bacterium]
MERRINKFLGNGDGNLYLIVFSKSREEAWTTLTNLGAKVDRCQINIDKEYVVDGTLTGAGLIQIEQLERGGRKWD